MTSSPCSRPKYFVIRGIRYAIRYLDPFDIFFVAASAPITSGAEVENGLLNMMSAPPAIGIRC